MLVFQHDNSISQPAKCNANWLVDKQYKAKRSWHGRLIKLIITVNQNSLALFKMKVNDSGT